MNRTVLIVAGCLLAAAMPLAAQQTDWSPEGLKMQRAELEELLASRELAVSSEGYSSRTRERARKDAELIRDRLTNGDFRLGDRIILEVQGEPDIPDTLTVENGPKITIPLMGAIPLGGVLRSELEVHLTKELKRYLNSPVVRASSLIRLGIMGSVADVGYYTVPADMLLSDALMHAGGPNGAADMKNLRIERTGQVLWDGEELETILADGRTLDQLNLRAGDQIVVPALPAGGSKLWQAARWVIPFAASLVLGVSVFR